MKKLFTCLLLVGIMFPGLSQNSKDQMLNEIGVMIAPGYSMINGGESWSGTLGFQVGLETQVYKWNENSSIYAGVLFSLQGASYEETYSYDDYYYYTLKSSAYEETWKGKVSLSYIYIPILYNHLWDNGFYAEGGIQPGFLLSAKDKPDNGESYDFKDYMKSFDLGIPVGAGLWIDDRISVGLRAVFGITQINDDSEMYESDVTDRNFMVLGVVRFKFNKE